MKIIINQKHCTVKLNGELYNLPIIRDICTQEEYLLAENEEYVKKALRKYYKDMVKDNDNPDLPYILPYQDLLSWVKKERVWYESGFYTDNLEDWIELNATYPEDTIGSDGLIVNNTSKKLIELLGFTPTIAYEI